MKYSTAFYQKKPVANIPNSLEMYRETTKVIEPKLKIV